MRRVSSPNQRSWVISTLLIALFVRALIPAGFMPAMDRPFSFQICPDGFPAALLNQASGAGAASGADALMHAGHHHDAGATAHAEHHHDAGATAHAEHHHADASMFAHAGHDHSGHTHNHGSASAEHCIFAAAAGAVALAWAVTFSAPAAAISAPDVNDVSPSFESLRFRLPPPRGPPARS